MADERTYDSPPGMLALFARAGAGLIPGADRLPVIGGGGRSEEMPTLALRLTDQSVNRDKLAAYSRVCGFQLSDTLPPTYPHILAFPLHLALMTDPGFPFPAIGLVHISNQITEHRPIGAHEKLSLKVWATQLEPHPRGTQFSLRTEASVGGEVVWEEVSTNLRRGGGGAAQAPGPAGGRGEPAPREREHQREAERLPAAATWRLRGDLGRRYASVSGDINPIHMHPLSARLFGFSSAIAHGMWTKARCLAALAGRLPGAFAVEVSFRRPILLPATVEFAEQWPQDGAVRFAVRDANKGTPHLEGSLRPR
jgi:acyl dehydratase